MYLQFWSKNKNGFFESRGHHVFDEESLTQLKRLYEDYARDPNFINGHWYKCTFEGEEMSRMIMTRFDDINEIQFE
jgi:hypothetical protein